MVAKISVGMPVYNGEMSIRRALDSLLVQSFSDFELIISDNGSSDGTERICREYAERDQRIRYIRQPTNIGAGLNFKFVLDEARSEYFMWAACDDVRSPDFLEFNQKFLSEHPEYVASTSPNGFVEINRLGLPAGSEFLDVISPQYIGDLIAWGAIGARTTESQVHRELASGLSAPIGFKNGTDGNIKIATDAIQAASRGHHFLSVHKNGQVAIVQTNGNKDCHVILRGGKAPNYDAVSVAASVKELEAAKLPPRLMVDCSHANSSKQHEKQLEVARDIAGQITSGSRSIFGVMIESHIEAGAQKFTPGKDEVGALKYGQSITDACLGWGDSLQALEVLSSAVQTARQTTA